MPLFLSNLQGYFSISFVLRTKMQSYFKFSIPSSFIFNIFNICIHFLLYYSQHQGIVQHMVIGKEIFLPIVSIFLVAFGDFDHFIRSLLTIFLYDKNVVYCLNILITIWMKFLEWIYIDYNLTLLLVLCVIFLLSACNSNVINSCNL